MTLNEYGTFTDIVWKSGVTAEEMSDVDTAITALGLTGEAGEVVEYFKKYLRDGKQIEGNTALAYELGDVLFYWVRLCRRAGFTPEEVMAMNASKLTDRHKDRIAARAA